MGKTLEELAKGEERERYHGWLGKLTQGWVEFPRPKADGLNVEERELDRISGSGKSMAHEAIGPSEAIEPSEAIDKI
jgi:hypothetical protein